jgi:hypothetical protein
VPVIVLSATAGVAGAGLRELGAVEVLEKPCDARKVLAAVRRHCPGGVPAA